MRCFIFDRFQVEEFELGIDRWVGLFLQQLLLGDIFLKICSSKYNLFMLFLALISTFGIFEIILRLVGSQKNLFRRCSTS